MARAAREDTRARILATAVDLFATRGYRATSIREIATRLGLTKAALYYHFRSKEEIAETLIGPIVADMEQVLDDAAAKRTLAETRRHLLEGFLDALLARREAMALLVRDWAIVADLEMGPSLVALQARANALLAGPGATWHERVRAAQAIACLTDPVVLFPEVATEDLRAEVLRGATQFLGLRPPGTDDHGDST